MALPARSRSPRRPVAAAALAVSVATASLLPLTATAADAPAAPLPAAASASASATGSSPAALTDGDPAQGRTGAAWTAGFSGSPAWVRLDLPGTRSVASVQVFGPPGASASSTPLAGVLSFSNGSSVRVSGIAGGHGPATTVAFAPRSTSWVRLDLERVDPTAVVALREVAVYGSEETPPPWPSSGQGLTVAPQAAACTGREPLTAQPPNRLQLVCPQTGAAVSASAHVVVAAPAGQRVAAFAWNPTWTGPFAPLQRVAATTADTSGRAVLDVDTGRLPSGPMGLKVVLLGRGAGGSSPLHVQLVNEGGRSLPASLTASHPPAGTTLRWSEEFGGPLSVSGTGAGALYASSKPERHGASQFGDAVFADPSVGVDSLGTMGGYLRVRAQPLDATRVFADSGQKYMTGFLSSSRVGGSGFSAQYGYFEARMLGAPGPGAWSAFWMLDSEAATPRQDGAAELDAVELYGHATRGSCHTVHDWGRVTDIVNGLGCPDPNGFADWATAWHTYGVQVTPTATIFSIDGVEVHRSGPVSKQSSPYFFMLDLALGGGHDVDLARTGHVSDLYVDWVRVYT